MIAAFRCTWNCSEFSRTADPSGEGGCKHSRCTGTLLTVFPFMPFSQGARVQLNVHRDLQAQVKVRGNNMKLTSVLMRESEVLLLVFEV